MGVGTFRTSRLFEDPTAIHLGGLLPPWHGIVCRVILYVFEVQHPTGCAAVAVIITALYSVRISVEFSKLATDVPYLDPKGLSDYLPYLPTYLPTYLTCGTWYRQRNTISAHGGQVPYKFVVMFCSSLLFTRYLYSVLKILGHLLATIDKCQ